METNEKNGLQKTDKRWDINTIISISLLLLCGLAFAYYFSAKRLTQQPLKNEGGMPPAERKKLTENYSRLRSYVQGNGGGEPLQFDSTGNTNWDAIFSLAKDFYVSYVQEYRSANDKIKALHEQFVTVDAVLTNKEMLSLEIEKRKSAEKIIQSFSSNAIPMCNTFLINVKALNVSEEYKNTILETLRQAPLQYAHMFAAWSDIQRSEGNYYEFLYSNFDDYTLQDDALVFKSDANIKLCQTFGQRILDARNEANQIQKNAITNFDSSVSELK